MASYRRGVSDATARLASAVSSSGPDADVFEAVDAQRGGLDGRDHMADVGRHPSAQGVGLGHDRGHLRRLHPHVDLDEVGAGLEQLDNLGPGIVR